MDCVCHQCQPPSDRQRNSSNHPCSAGHQFASDATDGARCVCVCDFRCLIAKQFGRSIQCCNHVADDCVRAGDRERMFAMFTHETFSVSIAHLASLSQAVACLRARAHSQCSRSFSLYFGPSLPAGTCEHHYYYYYYYWVR